MQTRHWRNPDDYAYTKNLCREHWAWEFLRRNPEYRTDWLWFSTTWKALETDYGRPPHRDFLRWQRDPRAYRPGQTTVQMNVRQTKADEGERVLIECWMGIKWGFYKFPLDPSSEQPLIGEQLAWRPVPIHAVPLTPEQCQPSNFMPGPLTATSVLTFDLSLPLKAQLDAAKNYLIVQQRRLKRGGKAMSTRVTDHVDRWTLCLRALDAFAESAETRGIASQLFPHAADAPSALSDLLAECAGLCSGDHRRILLLEN